MNKILTIGIPTYKRVDEVRSLLEFVKKNKLYEFVDILLIDDGPSLDLPKIVSSYIDVISFFQHEENKGYANTFCELIENCKTEYILITSDDDHIIAENIPKLLLFLKNESPDFISTQWLRNGKIHRGKKNNERISFSEIGQASNHAPGLIYKVSVCTPFLLLIKQRIKQNCQAVFFYPQVVLLFLLELNDKKCIWGNIAVIKEGFANDSGLKDKTGNSYFSFQGRWNVYVDFIEVFDMMSSFILSKNIKKLEAIKALHKQQAFERLAFVVEKQYPEIYIDFLGGAFFRIIRKPLKTFCLLMNFFKIKLINRSLLKNNS